MAACVWVRWASTWNSVGFQSLAMDEWPVLSVHAIPTFPHPPCHLLWHTQTWLALDTWVAGDVIGMVGVCVGQRANLRLPSFPCFLFSGIFSASSRENSQQMCLVRHSIHKWLHISSRILTHACIPVQVCKQIYARATVTTNSGCCIH